MHVKIILIEDDYYLRDGLCELLQKEDYTVLCAQNCAEGRSLLQKEIYDLAILDIMLPDGSGLDLCTELRKQGNETPILFLTACDEEYQIVRGLDAGADDYITKPFKMLEFLSRVRALLRRRRNTIFQQKDIQIDIANMSVKKRRSKYFPDSNRISNSDSSYCKRWRPRYQKHTITTYLGLRWRLY